MVSNNQSMGDDKKGGKVTTKELADYLWGELCKREKYTAAPHAYTVIKLMEELGFQFRRDDGQENH
jgi:hypothetical protein